jgi:hypothetical protein
MFCTLKLYGQKNDDFYIVDTITIKNPVVFIIDKYDGCFLTDLDLLNYKNIKRKSIIKNSSIFLFSFNPYIFFNEDQLIQNDMFRNYPNYGNCSFSETINSKNGIYYNNFTTKPLKFIVCLIKASHYNKIVSSADLGKTILYKSDKNRYFKIVFPFCEKDNVP